LVVQPRALHAVHSIGALYTIGYNLYPIVVGLSRRPLSDRAREKLREKQAQMPARSVASPSRQNVII